MSKAKTSMQMMAEAVAPTKDHKVTDGVKATPPARAKAESTAPEVAKTVVPAGDTPAAAAPVVEAKAKKEAGPVKIETNQQLLKALWSSRGLVFLKTPDFPVPIAVVKSTMTDYLKNSAKPGDAAPYDLVPRADNSGSDLVPMKQQ